MTDRCLRIVAPHFVAGIVGDTCAPIVRYMATWSEDRIRRYCRSKGWIVETCQLPAVIGVEQTVDPDQLLATETTEPANVVAGVLQTRP
jgi:hypothetical protein